MKHTSETLKESLSEVFDPASIHYIRQELWLWFRHASEEEVLLFEGNPAAALLLEKIFKRMIRYAWHILQEENDQACSSCEVFPVMSPDRIQQERQQMKDHKDLMIKYRGNIRRLRKPETDHPVLFFRRFFSHYHTKKEWFKLLHRWSEYSLSSISLDETGLLDLKAYELLEGLLESMYLLHIQEHPKEEHLDPVVRLIIEVLAPQMIFEVKHQSLDNGNEPYTDLLIIIPDTRQKRLSEMEPVLELVTVSDHRLSCSLHTSSHIKDRLKAGHIYFSLVCIPQNLIYGSLPYRGDAEGRGVLPEMLSQIITEAQKAFETGHQKAQSFHASAIEQQQRSLALFMLQQAAELVFRTIALALYGCGKKTHSFKVLKQITRRVAPALNDLFPEDTPEEKRLLQLLEDAYIHGRYSGDFEVLEEDFQTLYHRVEKSLSLSREVFDERIALVSSNEKHLIETSNG